MSYTVFLFEEAIKDIEAIYRYIRKSGNKKAANIFVFGIIHGNHNIREVLRQRMLL